MNIFLNDVLIKQHFLQMSGNTVNPFQEKNYTMMASYYDKVRKHEILQSSHTKSGNKPIFLQFTVIQYAPGQNKAHI